MNWRGISIQILVAIFSISALTSINYQQANRAFAAVSCPTGKSATQYRQTTNYVKSVSATYISVEEGVKISFNIETKVPIVPSTGSGQNLPFIYIYKNNNAIAASWGGLTTLEGLNEIDSFTPTGSKTGVGTHLDKGVQNGASYKYQVTVYMQNPGPSEPNCTDPEFITFEGGESEAAITPPCPTNIRGDGEKNNASDRDFTKFYILWDFEWTDKPDDADIIFEPNLQGFGNPENQTFTENKGWIRLRAYEEIIFQIIAVNKTDGSRSTSCTSKSYNGGDEPTEWTPDGYPTAVDGNADSNCTINWVIYGGKKNPLTWAVGFFGIGKNAPPEFITRLGIDGEKLNPFSRMSVCLYIWTVLPLTE